MLRLIESNDFIYTITIVIRILVCNARADRYLTHERARLPVNIKSLGPFDSSESE